MNAQPTPENSPHLHRRIDRALARMTAAKSTEWAHRWGDIFCIYVRARNSMRTPAEIRELENARGIG